MPVALFLTCLSQEELFIDDQLMMQAFECAGWKTTLQPWNGPALDWSGFDIAVIRTTWDYYKEPAAFLQRLFEIDQSSCELWNPYELIRWNSEKSYLKDLEERGILVPETIWDHQRAFFDEKTPFERFQCEEIVLKPQISVGAFDTLLLKPNQWDETELFELYKDKKIMVQRCLSAVRDVGEHSFVFFAGNYSHTMLKTPKKGDFRVQSFYGGVERPITPGSNAILEAGKVIQALQSVPLYARVDMVEQDSQWLLMELELIEPQLFLPQIDFNEILNAQLLPFLSKKWNN
jgi:hypothetical protein